MLRRCLNPQQINVHDHFIAFKRNQHWVRRIYTTSRSISKVVHNLQNHTDAACIEKFSNDLSKRKYAVRDILYFAESVLLMEQKC